ncbi:protein S40-3 [Elaeis guineensis]|uniref:protein S40-3 n=1 Tax=Elaeis guineensis var. tenera TaxID=51953 RepID=UPI003C6CCC10
MEEFQEADVLWSHDNLNGGDDDDMVSKKQPSTQPRAPWKESAPVDIPKAGRSWARSCTCHHYDINSEDGDGDHDDLGNNNHRDHEKIPPHIIVARRTDDKMAFSVCTGLKGRHLRHVRNSILRMTGFLER